MTKKITIGLFGDSFFPLVDGVSSVMDNYAKNLMKYANVIVFVPQMTTLLKYDDSVFPYKVVRCNSIKIPLTDYSFPMPRTTINFMKELKSYKLDLIHIHSPFIIGKYALKYAKKYNIPVIGTMHSQFKRDFQRYFKDTKLTDALLKRVISVFNDCDECWAVNAEVGRLFHQEYGYKTMPYVTKNATDFKLLEKRNISNNLVNKKYNLKNNELVFLYVGRINKIKNILFIIDALKILKDKNIKFKMLFVGIGQDQELLEEHIMDNSLEKEIIFCGKIEDRELLRSIYARSYLLLFPSLYDTNSLVQIEAASQKVPTVFIESVTSSGVINGINGFISNSDVVEYSNLIIKILKDKKLYDKVKESAYRDLCINWEDYIKEVYNRYLFIIENKK